MTCNAQFSGIVHTFASAFELARVARDVLACSHTCIDSRVETPACICTYMQTYSITYPYIHVLIDRQTDTNKCRDNMLVKIKRRIAGLCFFGIVTAERT